MVLRKSDPRQVADFENRHGSRPYVPKEFFCPISYRFIDDPVKIPGSRLTYDRDSVKHLHEPENLQPDLRMRKRMEAWFYQYTNDPPFDSISTRGFLIGSASSIAKQRDLSLLRQFASAIKGKPWLLKNGVGMWCVATLLSSENPSASWVFTVLCIPAHVDDKELFLVPEDIDIGIHPAYCILDPIRKSLEYFRRTVSFQRGFANFLHGLVMSSPDICCMEGKMEGIIETLIEQMWSQRVDYRSVLYLRQLVTLECLSHSHEFSEKMCNSDHLWSILVMVMDSEISFIEGVVVKGDGQRAAALLAIGRCMRILERVCCHSLQANKSFYEKVALRPLLNHFKLAGHYVECSHFLNQFLGEHGAQFRIDIGP